MAFWILCISLVASWILSISLVASWILCISSSGFLDSGVLSNGDGRQVCKKRMLITDKITTLLLSLSAIFTSSLRGWIHGVLEGTITHARNLRKIKNKKKDKPKFQIQHLRTFPWVNTAQIYTGWYPTFFHFLFFQKFYYSKLRKPPAFAVSCCVMEAAR